MKLSTNMIAQALALIVQGANQFAGIIPAKYNATVALVVGVAQLIGAYLAHHSNTDGTPQSVPGPIK